MFKLHLDDSKSVVGLSRDDSLQRSLLVSFAERSSQLRRSHTKVCHLIFRVMQSSSKTDFKDSETFAFRIRAHSDLVVVDAATCSRP